MTMKALLTSLALALVASAAFAVTFVPIAGEVSVVTSSNRRAAAVTVSNGDVVAAQFCVTFPKPLEQPINIHGRGHVIYLPRPIEGMPHGMKINGPEPIAQTLTVVPQKGPAFAFVAEGVKPIYNNAQPIVIASVVRQDWTPPEEERVVPGIEACLTE
jgi:hypothetical protein